MASSTGLTQSLNVADLSEYESDTDQDVVLVEGEVERGAGEEAVIAQDPHQAPRAPTPGSRAHVLGALERFKDGNLRGEVRIPLSARKAQQFVENYVLFNDCNEEKDNVSDMVSAFRHDEEEAFKETLAMEQVETPDEKIIRLERRLATFEGKNVPPVERRQNRHDIHPYRRKSFDVQPTRDSNCSFCDDSRHESISCHIFMTADDRLDRLQDLGRCTRCLGRRHPARECRKPPPELQLLFAQKPRFGCLPPCSARRVVGSTHHEPVHPPFLKQQLPPSRLSSSVPPARFSFLMYYLVIFVCLFVFYPP